MIDGYYWHYLYFFIMLVFVVIGALVTGLSADCVDLDNQCQGWSRHCGIEVLLLIF